MFNNRSVKGGDLVFYALEKLFGASPDNPLRTLQLHGNEAKYYAYADFPAIESHLMGLETSGGYIAQGMSKAHSTGDNEDIRPSVVLTTFGPGTANMFGPTSTAFNDNIPLIVIAGQVPQEKYHPGHTHQCIDNVSAYEGITRYSAQIHDVNQIVPELIKAAEASVEGTGGPVLVEIMADALGAPYEGELPTVPQIKDMQQLPEPQEQDVQRFLDFLQTADNPVIYVGREVRDRGAVQALDTLLKKIPNIPVITAYDAMDTVDGERAVHHCTTYAAGILTDSDGKTINPEAEIVQRADAVLCVGFHQKDDVSFAKRSNIKTLVNVSCAASRHSMPDSIAEHFTAHITASPKKFCEKLTTTIKDDTDLAQSLTDKQISPEFQDKLTEIKAWKTRIYDVKKSVIVYPHHNPRTAHAFNAVDLFNNISNTLRSTWPGSIDLVFDTGTLRHVGHTFGAKAAGLRFDKGDRYDTLGGGSPFGAGHPAAIGHMLANTIDKERYTIGIAGDAGTLASVPELAFYARIRKATEAVQGSLFIINNNKNGLISGVYDQNGAKQRGAEAYPQGYTREHINYSILASSMGLSEKCITNEQDLRALCSEGMEKLPNIVVIEPTEGDFYDAWMMNALSNPGQSVA